MKYLILLALLLPMVCICIAQGQNTCPLGGIFYTYSVPEGWNVIGMGCCGLVASDSANPARGIIALNHLHGTGDLPAYTTPESYLENYMPQDFSQGSDQITNMRIISYEGDQNLANLYASYAGFMASGKAMRCTFEVNGIPAEGSFTVITNELSGYGTTIPFLGGIFSPADKFDTEAPKLIDIWTSIKLMSNYQNICIPPEKCLSWQYWCSGDQKCCSWPCNGEDRCY